MSDKVFDYYRRQGMSIAEAADMEKEINEQIGAELEYSDGSDLSGIADYYGIPVEILE